MDDTLLKYVDERETIELLQAMLRLNSVNPPGGEQPVAQLVADTLATEGFQVGLVPLGENRANVVARLPGEGGAPAVVFCGHLDTVHPGELPWEHDPFGGEIADGRLYGRGTVDMKGGVAAMMMGAVALARSGVPRRGDLLLIGTAGEEVDCLGAQQALDDGLLAGAGALVIGEPTNLALATAHRGALWLELTVQGKTAHGGAPDLGVNAITAMMRVLTRLADHSFAYRPHPLLRPPTVNIATIDGGFKVNVVPDLCRATVDIRTLPEQSHPAIKEEVAAMLQALEREVAGVHTELRVLNDKPAIGTPVDAPLVRQAQRVAARVLGKHLEPAGMTYFTDASVLVPPTGIPTIFMGPGDNRLAHQPNEFVEISKLTSATRFFAALAADLLG